MTVENANQLRANLVQLASGSLADGILHEPRAFYDVIDVDPDGQITPGNPEVFKNGERHPIRLTHMTAALAAETVEDQPAFQDERNIQRIGMRMEFHNQFYQNPEFLPLPLWGDMPTAASPQVSFGTSAWEFDVPFILSARDTLTVEVELSSVPSSARRVNVSFVGIGLLSGREYLLNSEASLDSVVRTKMSSVAFRNDGSEPMILSRGTCNVSAPVDEDDPTGDIRVLSLQVRQVGNGTNANWFQGPTAFPLMPAVLWGVKSGRCVVHKFPGDGLLWEPGEGISLELQSLSDLVPPARVFVGLTGYITVS